MGTDYNCPLCNQSVSKKVYEEITGIWQAQKKALQKFEEKKKAYLKQIKEIKIESTSKLKNLNTELSSIKKEQNQKIKQAIDIEKNKNKKNLAEKQEQLNQIKNKIILEREQNAEKINSVIKKEHERQKTLFDKKEATLRKELSKSMSAELKKSIKSKETALELKNTIKIQNIVEKESERRRKLEISRDSAIKQLSSYNTKIQEQEKQIGELTKQLENETTPQIEGLLHETELLIKLKKEFPTDNFQHPGKGGDLIQQIKNKGNIVGIILFECKKVKNFSKAHIVQTAEAKQQRNADYAILVTNASNKNYKGFGQERGIIIVHPAGILAITRILRDNLLKIDQLKLNETQKNEAIKRTLEYLEGPEFKNNMEDIIQQSLDLYDGLTKEVKVHFKDWKKRLESLKRIYAKANMVEQKTFSLLSKEKELPKQEVKLLPINDLIEEFKKED